MTLLVIALYVALIVSFGLLEHLRRIIVRYEKLLQGHGIPHSRRPHGTQGFYNHADTAER